jgi:PAS domain-containing protein
MTTTTTTADTVVLLSQAQGIALIPRPTALTRLNFYDGKFLRATDMTAEQEYHRRAQQFTAQAGGSGVVNGFELRLLAGDQVELAAGLAIDPEGRLLFMPQDAAVQVADLIARSSGKTVVQAGGSAGSATFTLCEAEAVTPTAVVSAGTSLYVLGISHAEALCGQEDVFGKLCEEACVSGTERPQRLEGVVLRALPLQLATPLPTSKAVALAALHLRSRLASAYYADEALQIGSLISGAGLLSPIWCHGAAAASGSFLPLAVLARAGSQTLFIDGWTARRERVDGTPRRTWQWRMAMRPWDVFLAQVLQFQCQLRDGLSASGGGDDACVELKRSVTEVSQVLAQLEKQYSDTAARLAGSGSTGSLAAPTDAIPLSRTLLASAVQKAQKASGSFVLQPSDRVLISRGIVELPSAGYLPVAPGSAITVNEQVRRLLGEGVDLRFCVVRPDFVAHALEEAQHMQRISLLRGLDNPSDKDEVDVLVPDGQILSGANQSGAGWEVRVAQVSDKTQTRLEATAYQRSVLSGAGRSEALAGGELSFFFAGLAETPSRSAALAALKAWAAQRDNGLEQTLWKSVALMDTAEVTKAPAAPSAGQAASTKRSARAAAAAPAAATSAAAAADAADVTPQELATRYAALREQAVAYRLKTLERVALKATPSGIRHFEGLTTAPDSDHVAVWLALRSDANPLAAAAGARIGMSLDLSLLSPKSGGSQFVDIAIVGAQLLVESQIESAQRQVVQGTLRGAAIISGLVGTLANAQRGLQFSVPVLIAAQPTPAGAQLRVEIDFSSLLFDGRGIIGLERLAVQVLTGASGAPDGQQVQVQVALAAEGTALELAARLQRNDKVLTLGNPLRTASEAAIDVLATRESAPAFATQARADLFGARPAQADALVVRATRDWVLFHRRRNKQCGAATAAAVAESRRYELHQVHARSEAQLRTARAAVISANAAAIRKAGFAPVGAVEFDGGRSTLATPAAALLSDWQSAKPGALLRFGAIGSQGAALAEGDALAQARLAALEQVLAQGQPETALENQVLPVLPALNLAGYDGAIFVVTLDPVVACQDVFRVAGQAQFKVFNDLVQRGGLAAAIKELQLTVLAHVEFQADGASLTSDSLQKLTVAWGTGGAPQATAEVFHAGGATNEAAALAQGQSVLKALSAPTTGLVAQASTQLAQATPCGGLLVLVAPEPVTVTNVLVGFAPYDGRFIITPNTPFTSLPFDNGQPRDAKAFSTAVATALRNQPVTLTTAVKTEAELAATAALKALAEGEVKAQGYGGLRISDTAVLQDTEVNALAAQGFDATQYDFVLVFSNGRPGN